MNYLAPHLRSDPWTEPEDALLVAKINELGCSWSLISRFFPRRSDNDVKNRWYSHLRHATAKQGGVFVFTEDGTKRKKRKRVKVCPQQSAWLLLDAERQSGAASREEVKDVRDECSRELVVEDLLAEFWEFE
jgi:hypothetical protein